MKGTITFVRQGAIDPTIEADRNNKQVIFKHCALFTDCISELNNAQINNVENLDIVILMYNLIEYSKKLCKSIGYFIAAL